jgi:hypothetical protein
MPTQPDYQRLPGSFRPLTFSGLKGDSVLHGYLGPDHLLLISQGPYTETTRHVFYEDILAVSVSGHWESRAWGWFSGLGAAVSLAAMAVFPDNPPAQVAFGILAVLFAAVGALNLWLGPACRCRMLTPGGWRKLGLWDRWPAAKQGLAVLTPRLEAVQGPLSSEAPVGQVVPPPPQAAAEAAPASASGQEAVPAKHHARGALALSALCFLLSAVYDGLILVPTLPWSSELSTALTYTAWACACVALALALRGGRMAVGAAVAGLIATGLQYLLAAAQAMALAVHLEGTKHSPSSADLRAYIHVPSVLLFYAAATLVGVAAGVVQLWAALARPRPRA